MSITVTPDIVNDVISVIVSRSENGTSNFNFYQQKEHICRVEVDIDRLF